MLLADLTTTRELPAISSLEEWTDERTVVDPRSRRQVLRAMRRREAALSLAARIHSVIDEILACDIYGELHRAAGFGPEVV